jgi:hypothetical protein
MGKMITITGFRIDAYPFDDNNRGTFHVADQDSDRDIVHIAEYDVTNKRWTPVPGTEHPAIWVEFYGQTGLGCKLTMAKDLTEGKAYAEKEYKHRWTRVYTRRWKKRKWVDGDVLEAPKPFALHGPLTLDNFETPIHELPIILRDANQAGLHNQAVKKRLQFRSKPEMLFGGYYVDDSPEHEGECYYIQHHSEA